MLLLLACICAVIAASAGLALVVQGDPSGWVFLALGVFAAVVDARRGGW